MVILEHPQVAYRDCAVCQQYMFDEKTGHMEVRRGKPSKRPANSLPPCRSKGVGCPKGTPEQPKTLSNKNRSAYQHYLECKAVGSFPDDAIVRRNAMIIRDAEDESARIRELQFQQSTISAATVRRK